MSPADRTEPQRRLRRVGIAPVIHHVAKRDYGNQVLDDAVQSGASRQEPQDLQSVLCEADQNIAEFAIDAWKIERDDYDVDPFSEFYTEQTELDEQRMSSLTNLCVRSTNPKTFLVAPSVPVVSSPLDMFICIPKNVFTPVEILSFMFLNTCRETGSSVNDANDFYYFVNHASEELGGKSDNVRTDECMYLNFLSGNTGRGKINSNKAALALTKREIFFSPVVEYGTCARGCYLFDADSDQNLMSCPVCSTERKLARHTLSMYQLPVKLLNSWLSIPNQTI
ncbi:hypothetical protein A0J61_11735 [Choanephora cucurbitarum]|uniref:Uncharacterized protein n=1 Tax=Choanephora cucurbitarum TaxID=101091 RepID=A0A1C7MUW2_9FUNG|nr:hypothetical protein A0J61_11735 [Choanephora cucurbitarum]